MGTYDLPKTTWEPADYIQLVKLIAETGTIKLPLGERLVTVTNGTYLTTNVTVDWLRATYQQGYISVELDRETWQILFDLTTLGAKLFAEQFPGYLKVQRSALSISLTVPAADAESLKGSR